MQALLEWLVEALPVPVRRRIPPAMVALLAQMVQFGCVGLAGFAVDTAVVYGTRGFAGLYVAGLLSYVAAVTCTWWLNRIWTFRGIGNVGAIHLQWLRFVLANIPGFCLNRGAYFLLVALVPVCADQPVIATFAGAVAGMGANFLLSRAVVFR